MGYSLASVALEMSAIVTLISGPTALPTPEGVSLIAVNTAQEMFEATLRMLDYEQDIFIGAAAVADYTPVKPAMKKIKKNNETMTLEMRKNPDILAAVSQHPKRPFTVGFAAETDNLEQNALDKLMKKELNMIAANLVGLSDQGFGSSKNELVVFYKRSKSHIPRAEKLQVARSLLNLIAKNYKASKK